ncbi:MAG TPA: class I SAM-dependent methyltransferase [Steroidobacteraceae bacterium]
MDQAVEAVLAEYDARAAAEEEQTRHVSAADVGRHIDDLLLRVGPRTGLLLNLLVKEAGARHIVEVGTSYGYSTVWLAEAARHTGGRVTTLEIHPGKIEYAAAMLGKAGLAAQVQFRPGDARMTLVDLAGPIDFVLLDLWKDLYVGCFDLLHPKLAAGAILVADNMTYPQISRLAAAHYRRHVRAAVGMSSVMLPIGSGLEVSRFRADP